MIMIPGMPVTFMFPRAELIQHVSRFNTKVPCFFNSLSSNVVSSVSVSIFKKKSEETTPHLTVPFPPLPFRFTVIITLPLPLSLSNI